MNIKKLLAAIEAILFASGEPVSIEKIVKALCIEKKDAENLMQSLIDKFDNDSSGINIVKLNDEYQMCTKPEFSDHVRKVLDMRRNTPLSNAAMEVLSIIAYNQPVTKAFVEQIRGVDCAGIISSLNEKNLIEEKGRLELPGRPLLYGTTSNFLRCLNISSLDELPPISEENFAQEEKQKQE